MAHRVRAVQNLVKCQMKTKMKELKKC
uniref:Uncharacterized protein n=1 Tax=Arundo donax TaxID=35708 RepID=A0A0A9A4I2_ARUDO